MARAEGQPSPPRAGVHLDSEVKISCFDPDEEIRERFYDIKDEMQSRDDAEIDNRRVFSTLFDLFWLHNESQEVTDG